MYTLVSVHTCACITLYNQYSLNIGTHDVQFAVAKPISGGVKIKGELAENTNAIGCFFVVRCQTDDPENYAISQKNPDGTCSTTVPDLKANNYTINVYDMESNAQPGSTPAVPLNVSVTNSGGSSGLLFYSPCLPVHIVHENSHALHTAEK